MDEKYLCSRKALHYASLEFSSPCAAANTNTDDDFQLIDTTVLPFNMTNSTSGNNDVEFNNLYPAVIECFIIIFSGYMAGRLNWISPTESKGLNTFVGHFSLPALIFLSMATLQFSSVNWKFLLSIFIAKTVVFFIVGVITLMVQRPLNFGKAGLFAIFCTQSNDFALGYPIVEALYRHTHKEYSSYLYLVAPISLVFLNPIGFILMEFEKNRSAPDHEQPNRARMIGVILKGVLLNPVMLMTMAGLVGNFIFQQCLPVILEGILKVLGSAFSATALFCLGLRMVGKVTSLRGKGLVIPGILIAIKTLFLPLVIRETVSLVDAGANVNETVDLSMYGFLYGTFPPAPGVFVYAAQYNLDVDLIASSMVACTFLSAPFMFVSAKMITLEITASSEYLPELDNFLFNVSIVGLICCIWVFAVFLLSKKWKKIPHCMTLCLVFSQFVACIGALLWKVLDCNVPWQLYLQFVLFTVGVFSSRIWSALLALSLLLLRWRSLCFVLRLRPVFAIIGWGIPAALVAVLCLLVKRETNLREKTDPNFQYGTSQATVACLVLLCSLLVTIMCLIVQQRLERRYSEYQSLIHDDDVSDIGHHRSSFSINNSSCKVPSVTPAACYDVECDTHSSHRRGSGPQSFVYCHGDACKAKRDKDGSCCLQDVEDLGPASDLQVIDQEDHQLDNSLFSPTDELCSVRFNCNTKQRQECTGLIKHYRSTQSLTEPEESAILRDRDDEYQMLRHIVLLLLLCLSMLVGFALCMWRLVLEEASGIYVELEFLDGVLNFGQGFFVFAVFGLDTKLVVLPFMRRWRRFWYGAETVHLPKWENLEPETRQICEQFMTYHYEKCVRDLVRDRRWRLNCFKSVFCGNEFVDWLMMVGLSRDRSEAVKYGRNLLTGQVIRHVENEHHFFDLPYFYTFPALEANNCITDGN